jgi:PAS domain S-box-containing protein
MIVIDLAMILVAILATGVCWTNRRPLKEANAFTGFSLIILGLWIHSLTYIVDFYTMTAMPTISGSASAMQLMHDLHTGYSWYINTAAALLMLGGVIFTVWSVVRQSTAVTQTRRARQESEKLLQSIFDNIPVGIIIKNDRHVIEEVNKTYLEWYGFERQDLIGKQTNRAVSFKFDEEMRSAQELQEKTLRDGSINTRMLARQFASGEMHYVRVVKFPIFDLNGRIVKVGSVSVDMTELLKAKHEAEVALHEAKAASAAKSRFLATMSHEFRTPLNAIIGFSDILIRHLFGPLGNSRYDAYAKDIHDSGRLMLELIDDVLDLSNIEAGKKKLDLEDVQLSEILAVCRRLLEPQLAERSVTLSLPDLSGLPPLFADRRAVKQILLNLLSNAVKFNKPNGSITVSAELEGREIVIRVTDTGFGIPADDIDTITEPFIRGRVDPLLTQPGTGLGLSIVSSLIDLHRGRLIVESEEGVGTTVTVVLPASAAEKFGLSA